MQREEIERRQSRRGLGLGAELGGLGEGAAADAAARDAAGDDTEEEKQLPDRHQLLVPPLSETVKVRSAARRLIRQAERGSSCAPLGLSKAGSCADRPGDMEVACSDQVSGDTYMPYHLHVYDIQLLPLLLHSLIATYWGWYYLALASASRSRHRYAIHRAQRKRRPWPAGFTDQSSGRETQKSNRKPRVQSRKR